MFVIAVHLPFNTNKMLFFEERHFHIWAVLSKKKYMLLSRISWYSTRLYVSTGWPPRYRRELTHYRCKCDWYGKLFLTPSSYGGNPRLTLIWPEARNNEWSNTERYLTKKRRGCFNLFNGLGSNIFVISVSNQRDYPSVTCGDGNHDEQKFDSSC